MSRIYKKTNFAGSSSASGALFGGGGGGGGCGGCGGGGFWSQPDTICTAAANVASTSFDVGASTIVGSFVSMAATPAAGFGQTPAPVSGN